MKRTSITTSERVLFCDERPVDSKFYRYFIPILCFFIGAMILLLWGGMTGWSEYEFANIVFTIMGAAGSIFGITTILILPFIHRSPFIVVEDGIYLPALNLRSVPYSRRSFIPKHEIADIKVQNISGLYEVTLKKMDGTIIKSYCLKEGITDAVKNF